MTEPAPTHSIGELMARDPLLLTNADLDQIIAELRKQYARFIQADDKKIGTPAGRKSGAQKSREEAQALVAQMNIDDILKGL